MQSKTDLCGTKRDVLGWNLVPRIKWVCTDIDLKRMVPKVGTVSVVVGGPYSIVRKPGRVGQAEQQRACATGRSSNASGRYGAAAAAAGAAEAK